MLQSKRPVILFRPVRAALLAAALLVHAAALAQLPRLPKLPKIQLLQKPDLDVKRHYIRDFVNWKTGRLVLSTRNLQFELRSRTRREAFLQFRPSNNLAVGVAGYYRRLGLELGFKLPASDERKDRFGNSRIVDWSTTFYADQFGA
ncbi:MAG TPA: hypothetical protein VF646_06955, partial [Cytophagales bacterium]